MSVIQVTDEKPFNTYRTEIPNIVFDIGLTCFELCLYAHLRRTAGPGGKCTKGVRRLAEETGMSTGKVSEIRLKLCESRPQLNGKPLIRVEKIEDDNCKVRHHVTIVDIWRENFDRFDRVHDVNTPVHVMSEPVQDTNTPCSPDERKKEPPKGSNAADAAGESSIKSKVVKLHLPPELDSDAFVDAWDRWTADRRAKRMKPYTVVGAKAQFTRMAEWGVARAIAAIDYSIMQQHQGIYEEKRTANKQPATSSHSNAGTSNASAASNY